MLALAAVLAGCTTDGIDRLPEPQRPEARDRARRCDVLERSFRPSYDRSGGVTILGSGFNFRAAEQNVSSGQDQYLAALNNMLLSCREWQMFEMTTEDFRVQRIAFASVYTQTIDGEAGADSLRRLAEEMARVEAGGSGLDQAALTAALQQQIADWRPAPVTDEQLAAAVADMQARLASLPHIDSRLDSIDARLRVLQERLLAPDGPEDDEPETFTQSLATGSIQIIRTNARTVAVLGFPTGSASPPQAELGMLLRLAALAEPDSVIVFGYADLRGSESANLLLSRRRAENVAEALRRIGGGSEHAAAGGETEQFGTGDAENRVVVVIMQLPADLLL